MPWHSLAMPCPWTRPLALLLALCRPALALRRAGQQQFPGLGGLGAIPDHPNVVITALGHCGTSALTKSLWNLGLGHCPDVDAYNEPNEAHAERYQHIRALLSSAGRIDLASYKRKPRAFQKAVDWMLALSRHQAACMAFTPSTIPRGEDFVWGWKEPHFIYLLPIMQEAYKGRTKFLVVARDPRDMCAVEEGEKAPGDGQEFENYGDLVASKDDCWAWWANTWNMVLDGYEANPNFAVVRIEDLVLPNPKESNSSREVLRCVMRHVGLKEKPEGLSATLASLTRDGALELGRVAERGAGGLEEEEGPPPGGPRRGKARLTTTLSPTEEALKDFHAASKRYMGGGRKSAKAAQRALAEVANQEQVHETMRRLGYDPTRYELQAPTSPSVCQG